MRIESLSVENMRRFASVSVEFDPGLNLLLGGNGAGKTTLLEAAFVLSYGRSFRRGSRSALQRAECGPLRIAARLRSATGQREERLGLERIEEGWSARVDGHKVRNLNELLSRCAVCCFEPGSHELISGPAELRRGFLDWGVFHVEPEFLPQWRHYSRALKHANALLRRGTTARDIAPWFLAMENAAAVVTHHRESYMHSLRPHFASEAARLLPELGAPHLSFDPGWDGSVLLSAQLLQRFEQDRQRAHVSRGPHRADWRAHFTEVPRREQFSRGQEKLVALAVVIAQAALYAEVRGEWPILLFDDLASELDEVHQERLFGRLQALPAQILMTATRKSGYLANLANMRVFHVEPDGQILGEPGTAAPGCYN